ncbi:MAG TPA: DUF72 domain-containing protein [Flavobacteriales bacterium]|nr:DUF72 domain-containing protein [Flavobacteriales bacterium]
MQFGRLENITSVDFGFPPTHPGTEKILGGTRNQNFNVYVGAPIWNDPGFKGKIYPEKARDKDFVKYYGQQFNCIELNATHYRIPEASTIQRWVNAVPEKFKFCPKIHQDISHSENINQCIPAMKAFYERIAGFGSKLGTCFLQLPPTFEAKKMDALRSFLDNCPIRDLAIELRHESWFLDIDALNQFCNYLYKNNFSLNITDVAGRRDVLHQRLTNKTAFIRFVANNLHSTDFKRMDDWVDRLKAWINSGLENVYFFVHTPDKSLVPELAIYFIHRLNHAATLSLTPPTIQQTVHDRKLF